MTHKRVTAKLAAVNTTGVSLGTSTSGVKLHHDISGHMSLLNHNKSETDRLLDSMSSKSRVRSDRQDNNTGLEDNTSQWLGPLGLNKSVVMHSHVQLTPSRPSDHPYLTRCASTWRGGTLHR